MASDTENLSDDTEDLPAEEKFLAFSRNGQTSQIKDFLVSRDDTSLLVNCKGMIPDAYNLVNFCISV